MAVPAPVLTVVPNSVTRTVAAPSPVVRLTDTATHSPAATARTFKKGGNGGTTVGTTTGDAAAAKYYDWPVDADDGVTAMALNAVNADGNANATTVNLTVQDDVAEVPVLTDRPGVTRQNPVFLPNEYRDPTLATPDLCTATNLVRARTVGTTATT